jgi:drug/metabolite transporter (DMT)-like permease
MPLDVLLVVLAAALMHASWNAAVKAGPDKLMDIITLAGGGMVICLPIALFLPWPEPQSWPYLIGSTLVHTAYFPLVAATYRTGDMALGYPVMRGGGVLLSAVISLVIATDRPGLWGYVGILIIGGGLLALALLGRMPRRQAVFGCLTAATIASYTLIDGLGARASNHVFVYALWLFITHGAAMVLIALVWKRRAFLANARRRAPVMLPAAGLSVLSYLPSLWAMTQAPIALVAALRETSIVFASLIALFLLKEPLPRRRLWLVGAIAGGAALIKAG